MCIDAGHVSENALQREEVVSSRCHGSKISEWQQTENVT